MLTTYELMQEQEPEIHFQPEKKTHVKKRPRVDFWHKKVQGEFSEDKFDNIIQCQMILPRLLYQSHINQIIFK